MEDTGKNSSIFVLGQVVIDYFKHLIYRTKMNGSRWLSVEDWTQTIVCNLTTLYFENMAFTPV